MIDGSDGSVRGAGRTQTRVTVTRPTPEDLGISQLIGVCESAATGVSPAKYRGFNSFPVFRHRDRGRGQNT